MTRQENLCRICMKEKSPMIPILEDSPLNIQEKMLKLLKIKISDKSQLPKQICLDCLTKLNNFNEFFVQSNENQVILQVLFNEKPEVVVDVVSPKKFLNNVEASTQTDPEKSSQERYFIIEELTAEGSDTNTQQISIVAEDESQGIQEEQQFDITLEHDEPSIIKNEENSTIKDINISFNSSKNRNRYDRFDCYVCQEQLTGNFLFLKHFASDHPKQEIKYQCFVCKGFVKKYRSYTRHLESHVKKRFECDICNQKFSQKITLMNHLSSHSNVKQFECNDCNLSFKQNSSLFKHRRQKHSNEVPMCQACNRSFVNKETYLQHLKSKHQESKDITCNECDKKFASKSALSYHKLSNHSKDNFQVVKCDVCFEEFKNKIILSRHKKKCSK